MLTDPKIPVKLEAIEKQYEPFRYETLAAIPMELSETREYLQAPPASGWRKVKPGLHWGGGWITGWFRGQVKLPAACAGKRVFLRARTGAPEALLIVDGEHRGVLDANHPFVMMALRGRAGRSYRITLEAYCGHNRPDNKPYDAPIVVADKGMAFESVEIAMERPDVTAFIFDLRTLRQLYEALDANSLRKGKILAGLAQVFTIVDAMPAETAIENWRPALAKARAVMKPLLACRNGSTAPFIGLTTHSHIDTAWLWPLKETWRKCARTFSSILNLMEQYPEMLFLQPAPVHAEKLRELYPALFKRVRSAVRKGRWEPNGAMYVEPDCNVPSGEAFARQLLLGAQATREMFGYQGDTLWLPDVFGYSAALPQILQQAGVRYFCTTKMTWNDTTRVPYDTFHWKGIDGTSVITHFNIIHWPAEVKVLTEAWNWMQHKDVDDRRLVSYGWGDGGGGPTAESLEFARRQADLEGAPRTGYTTLTKFMDSIRDDLGDKLPTYNGELYLEYHRGTLTSIARIKRYNRRAELDLRQAEFLWTLATLAGGKYPHRKLTDAWKTLLVNQFHDILPGSSIHEVNVEACADFEKLLADVHALAAGGESVLRGKGKPAQSLMLANSLSWDRAGEIVLADAPAGWTPADQSIVAQRYKDIDGQPRLAMSGVTLPALGAAKVEFRKGSPRKAASPFAVTARKIETPFAVVTFDAAGRLVSFLDRASGRELVAKGSTLNAFHVGQDVPEKWDNWDIDRDQLRKMAEDHRLVSREVVADGPLQLRIRSRYRIGRASTIVQDMVFHATTAQVDFETVVDWNEKHTLLKASFALHVAAETARHEIQFGHLRRATHTNLPQDRAKFEVCCHKWSDLSDEGFGAALLNDSKYGVSVAGGNIGLTLLKSGTHPDWSADQGEHRVTYSLLPHGEFSVESVVRPAYELNVPVSAFAATARTPDLPSLLTVSSPNVIVEALKWAQNGKAFIVRMYEAGGLACRTTVQLPPSVRAARLTNLLEDEGEKISLRDGRATLEFHPFEIKTLRCEI